ncbi:MAG: gamma-glutamyltransferase [Chloroflexi bacterium]|nr:MAG: gamma-glutamyltransferase [Chloroflexota bacterium]
MTRSAFALIATVSTILLAGQPALAARPTPVKEATVIGTGGAAASVDPIATSVAIDILRRGGNAVDAAVAAAAALGVVEPFSCGLGGGGFMVIYSARDGRVFTLDGRETAPSAFRADSFIDPSTGLPISFAEGVTSGLGVGVPGTPRLWAQALARYGTIPLAAALAPSIGIARSGFEIDQTFHDQVASNQDRFKDFSSTRDLYLPGGDAPAVGSIFRNPDLARTYQTLSGHGMDAFYRGDVANAIVNTVQHPPLVPGGTRNVRPGLMTAGDLASYQAISRAPTDIQYRGYEIFSMGPPSSGGSTVGEALKILEGFDLGSLTRAQALYLMLEASKLAYADRNQYVADPDFVSVPLQGLLSDAYAAQRRALIGPTALPVPVAPGDPSPFNSSTTHLTVSDRFGNVVSYTFTIEQIGGSGIVVPGRGFLLNNELTDFNFVTGTANSPAGGKRPRSSMSPTIVLKDGKPILALGSPGGASIITTVLQMLLERLDLGRTLPGAIATARISQRNSSTTQAEPAFFGTPERSALEALGEKFSSTPEIGAATGIEFLSDGMVLAAAEPVRRGGGSAMVVVPQP